MIALLASAERGAASIRLEGKVAQLSVELTPAHTGDLKDLLKRLTARESTPLLELPSAARAALTWSSSPESRRETAAWWTRVLLDVFAKRAAPVDQQNLERALHDLAASRGEAMSFAFSIAGGAPQLLMQAEVDDEARFTAALQRLLRLLESPAVSRPLEGQIGSPRVRFAPSGSDSEQAFVTFVSKNQPGAALELAWRKDGPVLRLVAAARGARDALLRWTSEPRLSQVERVAAPIARLAAGSSFAAYFDTHADDASAGSPAVLSIVPSGGQLRARAELEASLLTQLASSLFAQ
jgi:hypothetical protein